MRGATGLLEMDAPVGEPVQTGHVSARRGHYRLKRRFTQNDPVWSHCNTLVHLSLGIARPKSMSQNTVHTALVPTLDPALLLKDRRL